MSNILGNILVALGFEGAGFFSGMDKAEAVAKKSGKEIEGALRGVGTAAETALAPFGEFGGIVGEAFDRIGSSAASALESITKFAGGGGLGLVAGVAAGAAAAIVAADAAFIGIAIHAADNANKIYEMSEKTGIAVDTLSRLANAGAIFGLSADTMGKALEKMNKSVFAAATAADGTKSAYSRLGIEIKDANGTLRPTSDLLLDVADKFSNMPNGVAKTALAMQIFGRAGAEMIPFLNEGRDGIKEFTDASDKMGATLTESAALAAHQFTKDLDLMKMGVTGVENKIMTALVPALTVVSDQFVGALEQPDSAFNTLLSIMTNVTKGIITIGETVWAVFKQIGTVVGTEIAIFYEAGETMAKVSERLTHLDFKGAENAAREGMTRVVAEVKQGAEESAKVWTDYGAAVGKTWNPPEQTAKKKPTGDDDVAENVKTEETAQKQILEVTLARYKAQAAQARLYYEQGTIDAKQLVDAETTATNLSYQAHLNYFSKLKQLYADDPAKLQALSAEETKFKLDDLAKSTDELASATKKYNEEAAKAVALSQKDMAKEQAADLKKVEAATLAYVQSLRQLGAAQANLANASGKGDYAAQVEAIKAAMEEGRKSKADGWKEIEALDKAEGAKEVALLQQQGTDLAKQMAAAEQQVVAAAASGDANELRMAQANLNAIKAAYVNVQADIVKQNADFHKKMEADDAKYVAATRKAYDGLANAVSRTMARSIVEGKNMGQAFEELGKQMLETALQVALKSILIGDMQQEKDAGHAAASAFKWVMTDVPFPANAILAPIAAAAAFAGVMSFDKGGPIPGSKGQPVGIVAHGGETMLTDEVTSGLKNMIKNNRFPTSAVGPGSMPNVAGTSRAGGENHTWHIDARGADQGTAAAFERTMKKYANATVARSIAAMNDRAQRQR
jgi:hypothetical protein